LRCVAGGCVGNLAYNGPLRIAAWGDAPGAPAGTPSGRQVAVTWNESGGADANTVYKLLRVAEGGALDPATVAPCTSTTDTCCLVCTVAEGNALTCTDTNVAASPKRYEYAIIPDHETFPAPDTSYRLLVPIPPHDMVLVQRDSANYEMCQRMGASTDPFNHQRCPYAGLGAVPYNAGPGKPALGLSGSYYDFGYNLFVDRWEAACKWTSGACSIGNCYRNSAPTASPTVTAADGTVFYQTVSPGDCFVRVSGVWKSMNDASVPAASRALAYTNTASTTYRRPPIADINQANAWAVCQAVVDADYGAKRLLRIREREVAIAWPWLPGEPGAIDDTTITAMEAGSSGRCNTDNLHGGTPTAFNTAAETAASNNTVLSYVIGSSATRNCVSRIGAQDVVGNVAEWYSDQMATCSSSSHTCTGGTSTLDNGNTDFAGFRFDGVQGPAATSMWTISSRSYNANYLSLPLSIPLVSNDNGNALAIGGTPGIAAARLHNDSYSVVVDNANGSPARGLLGGGTWITGTPAGVYYMSFEFTPTTVFNRLGLRCVLPAE